MNKERISRRLKLLELDMNFLLPWLITGEAPELLLISDRLPADAALVGIGIGTSRRHTVVLIIESVEFEEFRGAGPKVLPAPEWGIVRKESKP